MFDFRYHVASLAAVFLALVVGIVIGVGLSGQGILDEGERSVLNGEIARWKARAESAESRSEQEKAAAEFPEAAYPAVMENRLAGMQIVVVFVGQSRGGLRSAITRAITDADGTIVRLRALKVPVDAEALLDALPEPPNDVRELGRQLGSELLAGGESPLWEAVADQLVIERIPDGDEPADAVIIARTAEPQQGDTARLLNGLYGGLTGSVPAVWVDDDAEEQVRPEGFAVLRDATTRLGQMILAVLLQTGDQGEYGPGAPDLIPPIPPAPPPETGG